MGDNEENKVDILSKDREFFISVANCFALLLICFALVLFLFNKLATSDTCKYYSILQYFWPQTFYIENSIDLTNFSDLEKCSFLEMQGLASLVCTIFSLVFIFKKYKSGKAYFSASLLTWSIFAAALLFICGFFGFRQHGVYALVYTQGWSINISKSLISVFGFHAMLFLALYSLVAACAKARKN